MGKVNSKPFVILSLSFSKMYPIFENKLDCPLSRAKDGKLEIWT